MKEETKITGFDGESCQEEKERYQIIIKDLFEKKGYLQRKNECNNRSPQKRGQRGEFGFCL